MEGRSAPPPPPPPRLPRPAGLPDAPYVAEAKARAGRDEAIGEFFTKLAGLAEAATDFLKAAVEAEKADAARHTAR